MRLRSKTSTTILDLNDKDLVLILSYFISRRKYDKYSVTSIRFSCKRLSNISNKGELWEVLALFRAPNALESHQFRLINAIHTGSQGRMFKVLQRNTEEVVAITRHKIITEGVGEVGLTYHMLRELSTLKLISHEHICTPNLISYHKDTLQLVFPYVELTLKEVLHSRWVLDSFIQVQLFQLIEPEHANSLLCQLLNAVAHFHSKGIIHRNLKPKHLLIIPGPLRKTPWVGATLKVADFAFARVITQSNTRKLTSEITSLHYRAPEILMGETRYSYPIDIWSIGCIYAEMLTGHVLFHGENVVDHIFQIYSALGTPTDKTWPGYSEMPYYQAELTPSSWCMNKLRSAVPAAKAETLELLTKLLTPCPSRRITAQDAYIRCSAICCPNKEISSLAYKPMMKAPSLTLTHMKHLLEQERVMDHNCDWKHFPSDANFIRRRTILIDWLIAQSMRFESKLCDRTLFFAVSLFDRFILLHAAGSALLRGERGGVLEDEVTEYCETAATQRRVSRGVYPYAYMGIDYCSEGEGDVHFRKPSKTTTKSTTAGKRKSGGSDSKSKQTNKLKSKGATKLSESTALKGSKRRTSLVTNPFTLSNNDLGGNSFSKALKDIGSHTDLDQQQYSDSVKHTHGNLGNMKRSSDSPSILCGYNIDNDISLEDDGGHYDVCTASTQELDLRLLGVACLHIASKCEDTDCVDVSDLLSSSSAWRYDQTEVFVMEQQVINQLDYRLYVPNVVDFIAMYLADVSIVSILTSQSPRDGSQFSVVDEMKEFCNYAAEISLLFDIFKCHLPSLLAMSIVSLALDVFDVIVEEEKVRIMNAIVTLLAAVVCDETQETTQTAVDVCKNELRHCIVNIHTLFREVPGVYKKYSSSSRCCIASISVKNCK